MIISFFEEFPTKNNLSKISLIKFPTKLYIASSSIKKLNQIKKQISSKYIKEMIWWPVLNKNEGYYFSPFVSKKVMEKILNQIKNHKTMIDIEFPYNKKIIFMKFYGVFTNKKIIDKILKNKNTMPCEHFMDNFFMKLLGLNYPKQSKIKMLYTSHLNFSREKIESIIKELSEKYSDLKIALGLIAHGVEKVKQPLLSSKQLERDLQLCKKYKIKEIILFRLAGLNKNYLKIIRKFST